MKPKSPTRSSLLYGRMEVTAKYWQDVVETAEREGRELTEMEKRGLYLAAEIIAPSRRREWGEAVEEETGTFPQAAREDDRLRVGCAVVQTTQAAPVLWIYGGIGDVVSAEDVQRELQSTSTYDDLEVHIHSDGGRFSDGVAIMQLLSARKGKVTAYIDGIAASAASLIAMGADEIVMAIGSEQMIHFASGGLQSGRQEDFENAADLLRRINESIVQIYMSRWTGAEHELRSALSRETWYGPYEAIQVGLADRVSDQRAVRLSVDSKYQYKNLPQGVTITASATDCVRRNLTSLCLHRLG